MKMALIAGCVDSQHFGGKLLQCANIGGYLALTMARNIAQRRNASLNIINNSKQDE